MNTMHEMDRDGANFAAGFKTAFAAIVVGVLVALAVGFVPALPERDSDVPVPAARAGHGAEVEPTTYFPSQFPLDAAERAEHVEAF